MKYSKQIVCFIIAKRPNKSHALNKVQTLHDSSAYIDVVTLFTYSPTSFEQQPLLNEIHEIRIFFFFVVSK